MKKGKLKQVMSGTLAMMSIISTLLQPAVAFAAENTPDELDKHYPKLSEVKEQLTDEEIVTAKDIEIDLGSKFDVGCDFTGLEINSEKVKVTLHEAKNEAEETFDTNKAGNYKAVYYVDPVSNHPSYQVDRTITVTEDAKKEVRTQSEEEIPEDVASEEVVVDVSQEEFQEMTGNESEDMIVVSSLDVKTAKSSNVKLDVGRNIMYPTSLGNYSTCLFYVDGHLAYCLESSKATPEEDGYVASVLEGNANLRKALYYGYGGAMDKTGERLSSLSDDTKYIFTHIAVSYFYVGESAFTGCSKSDLEAAGVLDWIDYLASMPEPMDPAISFSSASTKAEVSGDVQKTGTITLNGDSRNYISLGIPNDVTYHCTTTGALQTGGVVKIYGGQSFYFTAPYVITGTWQSGSLSGNVTNVWQALAVSTGGTTQDIGAGYYTEQKASPISFSVKWLDYAEVKVTKKDDTTGSGLVGAVFGIYSDEKCKNLIAQMSDTNGDGVASIKIPRTQEIAYLKEITAPVGYQLNVESFHVTLIPGGSRTVQVLDKRTTAHINLVKLDRETNQSVAQCDASLEKAIYGLYARENINHPDGHTGVLYPKDTLVDSFTTDRDGKAKLSNLYLGEYYVKEITPPEGYLKDENSYPVSVTYEGGNVPDVERICTVTEQVKKQAFELIKVSTDGSSTETQLVEDAEFTVKLQSEVNKTGWDAARTFDILQTDENGYALSQELPYGTYLVKETKTPLNMNTTKDFTVTISEDSRTPQTWRIFNDAPFTAYIRLIKKDIDTGEIVLLGGTTFKIRNTKTGEDVSMKVGKDHISTFTTDESGMVTTPLQMLPGEYEVFEITAPEGYVVRTESIPFSVSGTGKFHTDDDGDFVVDVEIENSQQYGDVSIYKHGEALDEVTESMGVLEWIMNLFEEQDKHYEFLYNDMLIEGAQFRIVCDEDIYTADHQVDENGNRKIAVYEGVALQKDAVAVVLTTDAEGKAIAKRLPLGSYHVEEFVAGEGYVLNKETDAFTLSYAGQEIDAVTYESDFENIRQKVELSIIKEDAETEKKLSGAVFGIYNSEDIVSKSGEILLKADSLIETITSDENGIASATKDYPLGKYYAKEITPPAGYLLSEEIMELEALYAGQDIGTQIAKATCKNVPTTVEITKTDLTDGKELPGATLTVLDEDGKVVESWVSTEEAHVIKALEIGKTYTLKETKPSDGYVTAEEVEFTIEDTAEVQKVEMKDDVTKLSISKTDITGEQEVIGAKLTILDHNDKVVESWTSEEKPYYLEKLPIGKYTLREEMAPKGFLVANDVEFEITDTADIQKVEMKDLTAKGRIIVDKTDEDSEEPLKGVEYEIRDNEGKVLEKLKTDSAGHAESEVYEIATFKGSLYDQPIKYYLVETKALDGYKLDETKTEIQFDYVDDHTPVIEVTKEFTNKKVPNTPVTPDTPETEFKNHAPKTGDATKLGLLIILTGGAGISIVGLGVRALKRRKRN